MKEKSPADTLKLGECEASEKENVKKIKMTDEDHVKEMKKLTEIRNKNYDSILSLHPI